MALTKREAARLKFCEKWRAKLDAAAEKKRQRWEAAEVEYDSAFAEVRANEDEIAELTKKRDLP